jgi:hypothetical protein
MKQPARGIRTAGQPAGLGMWAYNDGKPHGSSASEPKDDHPGAWIFHPQLVTGMSASPTLYVRRKQAGLCPLCGSTPEAGYVVCSGCRQRATRALKRRIVQADAEGRCLKCGRRVPTTFSDKLHLCSACTARKRQANAQAAKGYRARLRRQAFESNGSRCACCGETESSFLAVVGGDPGRALLCRNCLAGRRRNGGRCPHQATPVWQSTLAPERAV